MKDVIINTREMLMEALIRVTTRQVEAIRVGNFATAIALAKLSTELIESYAALSGCVVDDLFNGSAKLKSNEH